MAPTFSVGHTLNNVKCIIHCSGRTETILPPSDHYGIETVAPSGDHYCIDIVVPSSDHFYNDIVPPSSEHYGTTKVTQCKLIGEKTFTKSLGEGWPCGPLWLHHCGDAAGDRTRRWDQPGITALRQ